MSATRKVVLINSAMLNDFNLQTMKGDYFKRFMMAAVRGQVECEFIKPAKIRDLPWNWRKIRIEIFKRDDYKCTYCGDERGPFECDHVYPLARGGDSSEGNLTTACSPCNRSKRDMTVEEWRAPK